MIVFFNASASIHYQNQIFLPGGRITLKARSYAKPFGGRIGPPKGADPLLPRWPNRGVLSATNFDQLHTPNYSRYPGDRFGLKSEFVHFLWADYLQEQPNRNMQYYNFQQQEKDPDILAKDSDPRVRDPKNIAPRIWELAAIAPDLFDITYFTILPHYMDTYFPKLQKLFSGIPGGIRGDLGHDPNHGHNLEWQIREVWNELRRRKTRSARPILQGNPFYNLAVRDQLLSSWQAPKKKYTGGGEYLPGSLNSIPFSQCHPRGWGNNQKPKIAGGCWYGGRTGYSVKMISPCSLTDWPNYSGKILNHPGKCP